MRAVSKVQAQKWRLRTALARQRGFIINPYVFGGPTDPDWANVAALLHFDGADGSTTFTDQTGKSWSTLVGSPQISTAQSVFGGASGLFSSGSGISTADHADFDFGSGDFTVEFRLRPSSLPNSGVDHATILGKWTGSVSWWIGLHYNAGLTQQRIAVYTSPDGAAANTTYTPWAPSTGVWYELAVARHGSDLHVFRDGTLLATHAISGAIYDSSAPVTLCVLDSGGALPSAGYVDELRITKGVARYTATYTPATAAFPNS